MTKVKICGLRRDEDIAIVNDYLPDYAGFIIDFPASFRSLPHEEVKNLTAKLDKNITPVGVFVDSPIEIVIELLKEGAIGAAQLHGSESPEYIMKVQEATGKPVIKSFVLPKEDGERWRAEEILKAAESSPADMILLDAGKGSGQTFNWDLLSGFSRPYFLAGGISKENISHAIKTLRPYAVDISSSVETDRFKDRKKVKNIIELARKGSTK